MIGIAMGDPPGGGPGIPLEAVAAMIPGERVATGSHGGGRTARNVSLGLPFDCTSVEHATAVDIAGKDVAARDHRLSATSCARKPVAGKSS